MRYRAEQEVVAFEDRRHLLDELQPLALAAPDVGRRQSLPEVEAAEEGVPPLVPVGLDPGLELGVLLERAEAAPGGARVPQRLGQEIDRPAERTSEDRHRVLDRTPHLGFDPGVAERRAVGDTQVSGELVQAGDVGVARMRERVRVVRIGPDDGVEKERRIGDRPRQRPVAHDVDPVPKSEGAPRNATEGRLQAEGSAVGSGDADRAAAVGGGRERHQPARDGSRAPAARAPRRP